MLFRIASLTDYLTSEQLMTSHKRSNVEVSFTMHSATTKPDNKTSTEKAAHTAKWAVIMAKVGIRRAIAANPRPHWHLLTFTGKAGSESTGVVDMIAVRKDHGNPPLQGTKKGDVLQIILIQAKGGAAAMPTTEDAVRLRIVALHHRACGILLASWKKGSAAEFYTLLPPSYGDSGWKKEWRKVDADEMQTIFGPSKRTR
jgi:hypothetical protein